MKLETGFSWIQYKYSLLVTGDTQCHHNKHIRTSNKNHICIVILLYAELLCSACTVISLLSHIPLLNQNPVQHEISSNK